MRIPKKILKQINFISFIDRVIKENVSSPDFIDSPPEMWSSSEKEIFDALADLEFKLKEKVIEILTQKSKNPLL